MLKRNKYYPLKKYALQTILLAIGFSLTWLNALGGVAKCRLLCLLLRTETTSAMPNKRLSRLVELRESRIAFIKLIAVFGGVQNIMEKL